MARMKRAKRWTNAPKRKRRRKAVKRAVKPRRDRDAPTGPPPTLRAFQREGVEFLARHDWRVLLADAPGCGRRACRGRCTSRCSSASRARTTCRYS